MKSYEYLSVHQIADCGSYPFSEGQVRHYLLQRHKNGLNCAVRKIGKRLYVRRDLFEKWIESNQGVKR